MRSVNSIPAIVLQSRLGFNVLSREASCGRRLNSMRFDIEAFDRPGRGGAALTRRAIFYRLKRESMASNNRRAPAIDRKVIRNRCPRERLDIARWAAALPLTVTSRGVRRRAPLDRLYVQANREEGLHRGGWPPSLPCVPRLRAAPSARGHYIRS
ncbi:hypothetical protein [Burkholderia gladioli]|uniref:hypothetical protein n=1 Tax=Burkholderia gladioli TaxID=28095 RepID=UPI0012D9D35F|nr:hypothetical protein [Burkholderia gladioli]